jgi:minor extracellular protease Epr
MKNYLKRLGNILCAIAIMFAPVASGYCRGLFFQEQDPERLNELSMKRRTMRMSKKKIFTKTMAIVLVATMLIGSVPDRCNRIIVKATEGETEKNYIVETISDKARKELEQQYDEVSTISDMAVEVSEDNTLILSLTSREKEKLKRSNQIVTVEPDLIMKGSSEEKNEKVYEKWDSKEDIQWNLKMIDVNQQVTDNKLSNKIKVAVIDSGVDFVSDIEVKERMNFIPDQDEISPLYEDGSGHGTSVAGIIAAMDNDEGITGIDENVELYSAKVLDENNQAPISRVIEAIDWAIDKNVNIINMSLGTSAYSQVLHNAVKRASNKGILIVSAAGNGGAVEYPAAFDETLAVGSVGADGTISEQSSVGDSIDVVAPGEQILSSSAFDGVMASSGTSVAAPHVTGVAAKLWEKNKDVDANFIKKLICDSAKPAGDKKQYGYGIVDLAYALDNFDDAWEKYQEEDVIDSADDGNLVNENQNIVQCFDDVNIVEGRWIAQDGTHEDILDKNIITEDDLKVVKIGARLPDKKEYGINGKTEHPEFHGYHKTKKENYTNYIGYYYLLSKMAVSYAEGTYSDPEPPKWAKDGYFTELCKAVGGGIGLGSSKQTWSTILKKCKVNNRNKSLVVYGMAIHTATDAFSHSVVVGEKRLLNEEGDSTSNKQGKYRLESAKHVARKMLTHIKNRTRGYVSDFAVPSSITGNKFKMIYIKKMALDINETTYNDNRAAFDAMNVEDFKYYDDKQKIWR